MLKLDQTELRSLYNTNQRVILNYRKAYNIKYSHGVQGYIMQQFHYQYNGLPLSIRGRYHAVDIDTANKIINSSI